MEQKKRVRPTWAQVRALEKELAGTKEKLRLQILADGHIVDESSFLSAKI